MGHVSPDNQGGNLRKLCLLLCLLLAFGCSHASKEPEVTLSPEDAAALGESIGPPAPSPKLDMADVAKRRAIFDRWVEAADMVAKRADNARAKQIVEFLRQNARIMVPIDNNETVVGEGAGNAKVPFGVLPLLDSDAKLGKRYSDLLTGEGNAGAAFNPDVGIITIPSVEAFSPSWLGLIALHEGNHALEYMTSPYDWKDPKTFAEHERDTHKLENELAAAVGGQAYKGALAREVERLQGLAKFDGDNYSMPDRSFYDDALEQAFGPAASNFEKDYRQTHLWIDAVFEVLAKHYPQDTNDRQSFFLAKLYDRSGIMKLDRSAG